MEEFLSPPSLCRAVAASFVPVAVVAVVIDFMLLLLLKLSPFHYLFAAPASVAATGCFSGFHAPPLADPVPPLNAPTVRWSALVIFRPLFTFFQALLSL